MDKIPYKSHTQIKIKISYHDDDSTEPKFINVELNGFSSDNGVEAELYLPDNEHDLILEHRVVYHGESFVREPKVPNFTSYLVKLKKL